MPYFICDFEIWNIVLGRSQITSCDPFTTNYLSKLTLITTTRMMQANDNNAVAMMETGSFTRSSLSKSSFHGITSYGVMDGDDLNTPLPPTKTTFPAALPPPLLMKRPAFSVVQKVEQATLPFFPSLENEFVHDSPSAERAVVVEDEDMVFFTPSQSQQSPLSVDMFAIPRLKLLPRQEICHDRLEPTDERSMRLPMLPSLMPEEDLDVDHSSFQLSYRPSLSQFCPAARTA